MRWTGRLNAAGSTLATLLLAATFLHATEAQPKDNLPETARLLDALGTAIDTIRSFEVHVQVKYEAYFSDSVPFDRKDRSKRTPFIVYPEPQVTWSQSRQLFSRGWRRVEKLDPNTGQLVEVNGADNETERILFVRDQQGVVRRVGSKGIDWGMDYQETFRTLFIGLPTMQIFRARNKPAKAWREGRYVVFEIEPGQGGGFGHWGFRVWADPSANLLPAKTEIYQVRDGKPYLNSRMTVTERKRVAPGLDVPVKATTQFFSTVKGSEKYQQVTYQYELSVDVARSRWNEAIGEEAFRVPFPAGLLVDDRIRNVTFVVGKPDPGRNLEDLAANAKFVIKDADYQPPPEPRTWIWWTAGGVAAFVIVMAALVFFYRRRSMRLAA